MTETVFLSIPLIEWLGYLASTIVLISLSLSSFLRLRIINLVGSLLFSVYGFYIGALPVGIMNLMIVFFNLYYLQKLFFKQDNFEIIEGDSSQAFVQKFVAYFNKDITKYFPEFEMQTHSNQLVLLVMRNMNFSGLFIASETDEGLEIELDYVTPQFRDYKNGIFLFNHFREKVKAKKYKRLISQSTVPQQIKYLKKIGFVENIESSKVGSYYLEL